MQITDGIEWWAGIGGEPVGPLSAADVRARHEAGEITPSTLVWRAGFAEWKPAGDVPELLAPKATASTPAAWRPGAGSALAALAGAELAALQRPERPSPGPSGNARLDALTGASAAAASSPPPATPEASPPPAAAAARRRSVVTSAAATFAMGAVVAAALLVVFRGGDRDGDPNAIPTARAAIPGPASSAAPNAAASPTAPGAASASSAAPAESAQADSAMAREAVKTSEVRASNPPAAPDPDRSAAAASAPPENRESPAASAPRPERRAAKKAPVERAARARAPLDSRRTRPAEAPQRNESRVAMAMPKSAAAPAAANDPLAALPPPPPEPSSAAASSRRDPLANLVTDEDLDRELTGGAAAPRSTNGSAPSGGGAPPAEPQGAARSAARSEPRAAESAVYVPPGPGGDVPESVTPAQINEAVKGRMPALRTCIEEQRSADPAAKGTLKLRWVIAGDGSVKDLRNLSSELEGKPIARCIGGVVREIQFPSSRTSGQEVVFPFKF